jgi:hypothetical protein
MLSESEAGGEFMEIRGGTAGGEFMKVEREDESRK